MNVALSIVQESSEGNAEGTPTQCWNSVSEFKIGMGVLLWRSAVAPLLL